ncbi:MAG: helix-turn-helix domain-containing protein [Acidobacteria bacterium]|nr:helix-turn-helix domain-containing protein [Acidobacteriota bacterium]
MDEVFRAINDPSRRRLLDALFAEDGQTLGRLCDHLPTMTRYGVMNHLRVLEAAGLVTTRKVGRSKHHYLNPVPIRLIQDRWISKYAKRTVETMTSIKRKVEGEAMTAPSHVYTTYIAGSVADVWRAITDGDRTVKYFYETRVESTWEPGSSIRYLAEDGSVVADGEIISYEPEARVEMLFHARWDPELEAEGPVRQAWIVADAGGTTMLSVEMYDVAVDSKTFSEFTGGFPFIVSGLKTLVETGKAMAA